MVHSFRPNPARMTYSIPWWFVSYVLPRISPFLVASSRGWASGLRADRRRGSEPTAYERRGVG